MIVHYTKLLLDYADSIESNLIGGAIRYAIGLLEEGSPAAHLAARGAAAATEIPASVEPHDRGAGDAACALLFAIIDRQSESVQEQAYGRLCAAGPFVRRR